MTEEQDTTANDGYGLDKAARLRAQREREAAIVKATLGTGFPYEVEAAEMEFILGNS